MFQREFHRGHRVVASVRLQRKSLQEILIAALFRDAGLGRIDLAACQHLDLRSLCIEEGGAVMKTPLGKSATLIQSLRDEDDDEEQFKPLEWGLIRRLFTYTAPIKGKVTALCVLSLIRAAQLPAFAWVIALIINGPIARRDFTGIALGVAGYGLLAVSMQ